MWKFAGFDDKGDFLLYNKDGEVIPASQKSVDDKQYIGNYLPKVMMGWNNTFTYKNFDLGINMRSWIGFDVLNTYPMYLGIQDRVVPASGIFGNRRLTIRSLRTFAA